jgi:hypothetical protein
MDRLNAYASMNCCFKMRPEKTSSSGTDDEKLIVSLLQANENQMEFDY